VRIALVLFAACLATVSGCRHAESAGAALPKIQLTDERYKDLVFLVATVRGWVLSLVMRKSGPALRTVATRKTRSLYRSSVSWIFG